MGFLCPAGRAAAIDAGGQPICHACTATLHDVICRSLLEVRNIGLVLPHPGQRVHLGSICCQTHFVRAGLLARLLQWMQEGNQSAKAARDAAEAQLKKAQQAAEEALQNAASQAAKQQQELQAARDVAARAQAQADAARAAESAAKAQAQVSSPCAHLLHYMSLQHHHSSDVYAIIGV